MRVVFSSIFERVTIGALLALVVASIASLSGCTPDNKSENLGPLPTASFTVTPLAGKVNTWVATSTTKGAFQWEWDLGLGSGPTLGGESDTLFYDSAGVYRLTLTAFGHGGFDTTSQLIEVDSNAPLVNVLVNPSLTTDSGWTILNTGGTQTTIAFTPQGLNFSNAPNSGTNGGVYQAVQVQAGITYTFSATVTTPGSSNTWVEFYFGTSTPTQGSDYTDTKLWSLNTWSGCGGGAESGNIVTLNCAGSGATNGQITFATSETIYFLIKAGSSGGSLGTGGVTVSNVDLGREP
jgi:PKD repeat protein